MHVLFWYYLIENTEVFPTIFEKDVYGVVFLNASMVTACQSTIQEYIAKVIDPQVSFTTSESLMKNK